MMHDKLYQEIFENGSAAIAILEADTTVSLVNEAFCLLSGYSKDELVGAKWTDKLYPEEVDRLMDFISKRILDDPDLPNNFETAFRTKDNMLKTAVFSVAFLKQNQKTILSITDVTDNKVKLNIALKLARLGSWELNLEENLFYFNDTFYAIFKTDKKEVGRNTMTPEEYAQKFVHPEDYEVVESEIKKAIETSNANYTRQIEHKMLYANGESGYIAVRFAIAKDSRGKTVRVFGINQDITKIKNFENQLKENQAGLLELNSMKDKFFSIIAHDLQTPFSAIMSFSEILLEHAKTKDAQKIETYAKLILDASKKSMDLLANLMEWSRSETGRLDYFPQKLLLDEIVRNNIDLLTPKALSKKIEIIMNIPGGLYVSADKSMLNTILRNLISNAIKFSYTDSKITVVATDDKNEVVVEVADEGKGMPEKIINKLFRIDENVTTSGTENEQGTGLGLILCKEFVEKHGRRIWVKSEQGKGSSFYFTLTRNC